MESMDPAMLQARQRLAARAGSARTGGKGSMRRRRKAQHKSSATDDKRLTSTLKRLGVTQIPGIEEANLFKQDGKVIHFSQPKVQASLNSNTYVISGTAEQKNMHELLPGILDQLGADNMESLRAMAGSMGAMAGGAAAADADADDTPDVDNFEDVAVD
mmetsp:Transcript_20162/g.40361  ORF Transcript_20162/g.40361 Transcript_20162/m.40361 type:complete len:159 (+) Transcript_20162:29-505(+)|eukprot:CAMPEP_0182464168 /NCGR_PEP_ID=MMETSP1319-20130603/8354_1 /TAXON_ID=172717 /ORGANISM="Bolidomonas pacifica, Strain RCC208" /LENGTH=158 /DNA_ID=CAMNT_0024663791 /DNA_START=32 /DNA_END=505 /DNA_ORIENTATION=+